jgi:hypothetical protein
MYDSLPFELFSLKTLAGILNNPIVGERMMIPWCLLVVAVTWLDLSTEIRRDLLEIGCWTLFFYENPELAPDPPNALKITFVHPKHCVDDAESLYTKQQLRDGLNTFMALTHRMASLPQPFCLNRFGDDPLEHAFGHT